MQASREGQNFNFTITERECKSFLEAFDTDGNGVLDRNEYADFMKFAVCKSFIEEQYQEEKAQAEAEIADYEDMLDGDNLVNKLLDDLRKDIKNVNEIFAHLPVDIQDMLKSDEFIQQRVEEFNGLDADGSGTLELDELYPLIE